MKITHSKELQNKLVKKIIKFKNKKLITAKI